MTSRHKNVPSNFELVRSDALWSITKATVRREFLSREADTLQAHLDSMAAWLYVHLALLVLKC